jgi:hypothetical protein
VRPLAETIIAAILTSGATSVAITWFFGEVSRARARRQKLNESLGEAVSHLLSARTKLLLGSAIAQEAHIFLGFPRDAVVPFLPNMLLTYFTVEDSVHQTYEHATRLLAATNPALAAELAGRTHLLKGMSVLAAVLKDLPVTERAPYVTEQLSLLKISLLPMIDSAILELAKRQGRRIARSVDASLRKPFVLTEGDRINVRSMFMIGRRAAEAEEETRQLARGSVSPF